MLTPKQSSSPRHQRLQSSATCSPELESLPGTTPPSVKEKWRSSPSMLCGTCRPSHMQGRYAKNQPQTPRSAKSSNFMPMGATQLCRTLLRLFPDGCSLPKIDEYASLSDDKHSVAPYYNESCKPITITLMESKYLALNGV